MNMPHTTDETMTGQAAVKKSQALGWASKSGATTQEEAQRIFTSFLKIKTASQTLQNPADKKQE